MKRLIYLSLVLLLILVSCENTPEAHFYTDTIEPEVGQEIFFTNDSHNAVEFEWDFGDGYFSNDPEPVHVYTGTGSYEVIMTAYSSSGLSDKASITLDILIPTLLEIEVLEYYDEYPVANASVWLYPTVVDWEDETNVESQGYSDEDGIVVFSHLGPYVYYVDVWETGFDNYALKDEDIGFIRTPEIHPHKINRFVAYVDAVDHTKGERTREKSYVLKKFERKAADKVQPVMSSSTDNWQELYEKSVKLK
jgi:hypothetical protein